MGYEGKKMLWYYPQSIFCHLASAIFEEGNNKGGKEKKNVANVSDTM